MDNKWKSRKFLTTIAVQIAGLLVLFWPEHGDVIADTVQSCVALVVLVLSALGYVSAEASIDRGRVEGKEKLPPEK